MFFDKCSSIDELKREYRRLAFIHHPDKGGNVLIMQAINSEYTTRLRYLANNPDACTGNNYDASEEYEVGQQYKDIIEKIIHLSNIDIEICGKWIWVSGMTYQVREVLKDAGFWWASQKKKWYWRPPEQRIKRKQQKDMEWIRSTYGSIHVNQKATPVALGD